MRKITRRIAVYKSTAHQFNEMNLYYLPPHLLIACNLRRVDVESALNEKLFDTSNSYNFARRDRRTNFKDSL